MAGVLPQTRLLLTKNGMVVGDYTTYREMATEFFGKLTFDVERGQVMLNGIYQKPSYTVAPERNGFTPEEAIADWLKCYFVKQMRGEYRVYRYLVQV